METARERVLKTIDHIQPETNPVHIMGFEGVDRWLEHFNVEDDFGLRDALGLDIRTASAIYTGPATKRGLTIWGTEPNVGGYEGFGYSGVRGVGGGRRALCLARRR